MAKRILLPILLLLVIAAVWAARARHALLERVVSTAVHGQTGFGIELGDARLGLLKSRVEIDDLKLTNPEGYPERSALDIRRIVADFDLWSLLGRETRFTEVVLEVPRVVVVRTADGRTNLKELGERAQAAQRKGGGGDAPAPAPEPAPKPAPGGGPGEPAPAKAERPFRIDRLVLKIGTIEYHDYKRGGPEPAITKLSVDLEQEHENITSVEQLTGLLAMDAMSQMGGRFLGDLLRGVDENLESESTKDELRKIGRAFESLFGGGKE